MKRDKILNILEKIIIFLASLIMLSVLANQYIKTSAGARNESLRMVQVVLAIGIAILTLIMAAVNKNKALFFTLTGIYTLTVILFYVFKSANRI